MRRLMWFALGFAGACGLCAYALPESWLLPLTLGLLALALICALLGRERKLLPRMALILLGAAVGFFWFFQYDRLYLGEARTLDGQTRQLCLRVSDYSYETAYGLGVDATLSLDGKTYHVRAYLDDGEPLEPGDVLTGLFRCRVTAAGGQQEATYHRGEGIFLLLYQADEVTRTPSDGIQLRDLPARLRRQIQDILDSSFPADAAAFAKALLLGDTTGLSYETDSDLKVSGIRHIVAVSGLHVSILFTLLSTVTFRKRSLMTLLGFPALLLFAAVAGFTPSVVRACLMSALMLLALLFERSYDGASALSFAALVMLTANPLVITSVGFQLSVASVAGIFAFDPGIRSWLTGLFGSTKGRKGEAFVVRWFSGSVSVTLSALTFTAPLSAWYFGCVSLIGVVTNLLTLWLVSLLFYGLMALCLVYALWPLGAALLAKLLIWPIRYILLISGVLADFPLAAVYTRSIYVVAWLVFVYGLLLLFLLSDRKSPAVLSCCAVLGLCLALLASWTEPLLDQARLTVLDVGQGQCLLLQSAGHTYMIDCGGDSDEDTADLAAAALLSQGISRLDGLILTHCDRDHAGAAANLLTRVKTDLLILPPEETELALCTDGEVLYAAEDLTLRFEDSCLTVFASTFPGSSNETSLCILFESENCAILVTGDRSGFGERMLLRHADIPQVDVLIAGHHGSRNSTCEELLAAVQPEIVCISVGADNTYGHPAAELLERLADCGCAVYRTDRNGDILIRR